MTETLNLETLPSYGCEGVVHVIVNNQIGFTSDNSFAKAGSSVRSSHSSASPGFAFGMPVIHVNTQDVEAVSKVVVVAAYLTLFRTRFPIPTRFPALDVTPLRCSD